MNQQLTALAVIPGLLILIYVYTKDRVEKEPVSLIVKLVAGGAVACLLAGEIESIMAEILPQYPNGTVGYALVNAFLLAGFWEELLKYLALRVFSWKKPNFNYRFDGIVYGASSAVGFAVLENIMYVSMYGFSTGVVRAFTAVPLHAFCGIAMGAFYSYAKKSAILGQGGKRAGFTILALLVPMLIHGIYDSFAFMSGSSVTAVLCLYGFVIVLYIAAITTIKRLSRSDYQAGFYPEARPIEYKVQ